MILLMQHCVAWYNHCVRCSLGLEAERVSPWQDARLEMIDSGRNTCTARAVDQLKLIDPDMAPQMVATFLAVASAPSNGILLRELRELLGFTGATISRNVAALGRTHRRGMPGHDLVEAYENPLNQSQKIVRLTSKGRTPVQRATLAI
jgi:DNA-binding MarR family transcriptional regulator